MQAGLWKAASQSGDLLIRRTSRRRLPTGRNGTGTGPDHAKRGEKKCAADRTPTPATADDQFVRERAVNADNFDPAELPHGHRSEALPSFALAVAPILIVFVVNLLMSLFVLPRMYTGFLAEPRFSETSLSAVSGAWSVVTALAIASLALAVIHHRRLPELRKTLDTGANASVLLVLNTASMRG